LHKKHLLQASCYAYAVLSQGYRKVELQFVRVEQDDPGSGGKKGAEPQAIVYSFEKDDLFDLKEFILKAYQRKT